MRYLPLAFILSCLLFLIFSCESNPNAGSSTKDKNRFDTDSLYTVGSISFQLDRGFHLISQRSDLETIGFADGFEEPFLGTYVTKNIFSWLDQNAIILYKSLGKEKCDLIILIDQKQPLLFDRKLTPEFTKNFKQSLAETYQQEPFFIEEDYADNYKNHYYKTKFSVTLEDQTPTIITNYIITNDKSYYGMLVTNFGGHSNDYEDLMAALELN